MVGTDEPATLARVRTLHTDLVEPVAASWRRGATTQVRHSGARPRDLGLRGGDLQDIFAIKALER